MEVVSNPVLIHLGASDVVVSRDIGCWMMDSIIVKVSIYICGKEKRGERGKEEKVKGQGTMFFSSHSNSSQL